MELTDDEAIQVIEQRLGETFGWSKFNQAVNSILARQIIRLIKQHETFPHGAVTNLIWMNYTGGDTCSLAATRIRESLNV